MLQRALLGVITMLTLAVDRVAAAQAPATDPAHDALLAQVSGLGGCAELEGVDTLAVPFFPDVRFIEGRCTLEHGGLARPMVAVDGTGLVYPLDAPTMFEFLVRRHPPHRLDTITAVGYAALAARLSGVLPGDAKVARRPGEIPHSVWRLARIAASDVHPSGILQTLQNGARVEVLAWTPEQVFTVDCLVYFDTGAVRVLGHATFPTRRGP